MGLGEKRRQWLNYLPPVVNNDPRGFQMRCRQFFEWMNARGFSKHTLYQRQGFFRDFFAWCELRGITRPAEVTRPVLERYQRHTATRISEKTGKTLSLVVQNQTMTTIVVFFRWLIRNNHILYNPAADIELPRRPKHLPRQGFTVDELKQIFAQPDLSSALGLRDRAMMELIYSTGIRRGEVPGLKREHVNIPERVLFIHEGKWTKERYVPFGKQACRWLGRYIQVARPRLVTGHDERWLFLTYRGERFVPDAISEVVKKYIKRSGVVRRGSAHLFRHSCATHMLNNGADTRFIQALLGHERLETTQIYTRVAIDALKRVHSMTHPTGKTEEENKETVLSAPVQSDSLIGDA